VAAIELTNDNFRSTIDDNDIVLVDFWATWCGPCQQFGPVYEAASEIHKDIVFGKVNTEEQQQLSAEFGIRSIPTLMIFREQIGVFMQPGALPPNALEEVIGKVRELDMEYVRAEIEKQNSGQA
jgi:thioredoxin